MGNVWDIKARYKAAMNSEIGGQRGLFAGGGAPADNATIDYINVSSTGDATDFGDLTVGRREHGGASSNTRAVFGGSHPGNSPDTLDYVTIQSLGNAADMKKGKTTIRKEYLRFYNFCKGGNDQLKSLRRETMFIQMLEGLHPLDAEILCLVKDKELETKYKITKEIVSEAYPDIKWGGRS